MNKHVTISELTINDIERNFVQINGDIANICNLITGSIGDSDITVIRNSIDGIKSGIGQIRSRIIGAEANQDGNIIGADITRKIDGITEPAINDIERTFVRIDDEIASISERVTSSIGATQIAEINKSIDGIKNNISQIRGRIIDGRITRKFGGITGAALVLIAATLFAHCATFVTRATSDHVSVLPMESQTELLQ
jgi:hypothetical protein